MRAKHECKISPRMVLLCLPVAHVRVSTDLFVPRQTFCNIISSVVLLLQRLWERVQTLLQSVIYSIIVDHVTTTCIYMYVIMITLQLCLNNYIDTYCPVCVMLNFLMNIIGGTQLIQTLSSVSLFGLKCI